MFTAETALAVFVMLAISSISLFIAQRMKVPHTVFLVGVGVVLAVTSHIPFLHFLGEFTLTPELLFFLFLPTLIFESAFNINIKHLTQDAVIIGILSVVSLVVSAFAIAFGLDIVFGLLDLEIPFILSLVFGAIISATDPVAVLALFKEYGAPRRLSLIFEGESIFNDGTGVALFLVILAIAESGVYTNMDILTGSLTFIGMVLGGAIFGLIFGGFFAKLIGYTRSNEFASITLTMVLAHTTFICAELFNHHVTIFGQPLLLSSIIATAVASLLMGNYGRYKLPQHATEFVEKYWSQFAFLANSLIFILIGMLAVQLPASAPELLFPVVLTILIVAVARALSIYPIVGLFNRFAKDEAKVPRSWQHVLAWGSLRGALAVTMVLMIPDTLTFPGWNHAFTPKELVLTLVVSCVFATLFIKATTIGSLMKKLKLSTFTHIEEINYREMLVYIYDMTLRRLKDLIEKGYIEKTTYDALVAEQHTHIKTALIELKERSNDPDILERVIRLYAIGIERKYIRELYAHNEVSENVIKRVMGKLEFQTYAIEHNVRDLEAYEHGRAGDIFEYLAEVLRKVSPRRIDPMDRIRDNYLYYRSLAIVSRKVVKELTRLDGCFEGEFTAPHEAITKITSIYERYREGSQNKMSEIKKSYPEVTRELDDRLARCAVYENEIYILHTLRDREMVTPKVSIALSERLTSENEEAAAHV
jgi:monovalent cation:H+ antiporter, CPA1 family